MSRAFDNNTANVLRASSSPITALPITLACWFRMDGSASDTILFVGQSSTLVNFWLLATASSGSQARYSISNATDSTSANAASQVAAIWTQHTASSASATDHKNRRTSTTGSTTATSTTTKEPAAATVDRVSVGSEDNLTPSGAYAGQAEHIAIWNTALTDQDFISLGAGVSPLRMKRENLIFYAPVNGNHSPETDIVGGRNLAIQGTVAKGASTAPVSHGMKCV